MAVSIGKVVHASCESCSWYVCETNRMTSHVHDFVNSKRHARKKPLLRGKTNPTSWNLTEVLFPGNKGDTHLDEPPDIADSNKGTCTLGGPKKLRHFVHVIQCQTVSHAMACSGCKESHFYSLPFGQAEASIC